MLIIRAASIVAMLMLLIVGCGEDDSGNTAASSLTLPAISVAGSVLRDSRGRQVLLRGYNARVQGIFDVTFDDGRIALEDIPPFTEHDARRLEALGLDVLRLPVNWSGLEPQPQQYSGTYLRRIDAIVALGQRHHFYVLLDMHQDAYSKEFGEDGAPLWAIVPPPPMLLQGPLTDLDARRVSQPVLAATASFFRNAAAGDGRPLQDAFTAAMQQLVRRYRGNPVVVGYEAFNEPITSDPQLDQFHARLAAGVHAADATAPVFFEPTALRNSFDSARVPAHPWMNGSGVYAPHIYTDIFSMAEDDWASQDASILAPSMAAAAREAAAWGTPLFVGEFGMNQALERGHRWLDAELDLQDQYLASSTVWVWHETGYWGLIDADGQERAATVRTVSRPYPRAVAGDLIAIERPAAGDMRVRYRGNRAAAGQAHVVSASLEHFSSYSIRCDGVAVAFTALPGRAEFHCPADDGEHTFEIAGTLRP